MNKKVIKNRQTEYLKGGVWYNPNTFNALDGAIAYLIALVAFAILPYILSPVFRFFLKKFNDIWAIEIIGIGISQALIIGIALIFSRVRRVSVLSGGGYTFKVEWVNILMATMLILGIYFVFSSLHYEFVANIDNVVLTHGGTSVSGVMPEELLNNIPLLFLYVFVLTPVLPAVCEEALFRGVIMRSLEQFGAFVTVLLSGLMFSLMHGNYGQMILQFIGGAAMGWVVYTTKNFLLGTVMHFVNNFCVSAIAIFHSMLFEIFPNVYSLIQSLLIIVGIIMLIASVTYFGRLCLKKYKQKLLNLPEQREKEYSFKKVKKYCITSVSECDYTSTAKPYYDVQPLSENKDDDRLYFYCDRFVPFNKKSNKKVAIVLYAVGISLAVLLIVLAAFGI